VPFLTLYFHCVLSQNNYPIIGILTQPQDDSATQSYIAASYVKFIEGAGARVVPIFHNSPLNELADIFSKINGILFPGGSADLSPTTQLYQAGKFLFDLAIKANDNGDYFPMEGHCMGFQFLSLIASQNSSLLSNVELENTSVALNFFDDFQNSVLFKNCPSDIINILQKEKVTLNNHHFGVVPISFNENPLLAAFFKTLSWNTDLTGKIFISTMEAFKYPVYTLQWHAEKIAYEWNDWEDINHSTHAIKVMQYISDFFVSEARKSMHKFPTKLDEQKALIYNYPVTFTGAADSDFVQTYIFDK